MSVMSQCYSVIIDRGISAPGNVKEVVDGINDVDKRYIYINWCPLFNFLDQTDLIPRYKWKLATENMMRSLAKEFQQHLTKECRKMLSLIRENAENIHGKKMDIQTVSYSG